MMNETFWLSISLIIVLLFGYKPVKAAVNNFLNTQIAHARKLLEDAQNTYQDAESYLKKMEQSLKDQLKINERKLEQVKNQLISLALENEKAVELEIEKQLEASELQKKLNEELLKKELASTILAQNIDAIISGLESNNRDENYIAKSLKGLSIPRA
jgi:F0F1-type ATP synthase membrane subunit b/b'